jgi:hypothetical protein
MPIKQILAERIIQRYLQDYKARIRVIQPRWSANVASTDLLKRRDGLVLLFDSHSACHEGAFRSLRLKPTEWNAELSAISLAATLAPARVSLLDVEFALLERDITKVEELSDRFLGTLAAGFSDASDQQFAFRKDLTHPQRAFEWHHGQLIKVGSVIWKIHELSPVVERLAEHEGMSDALAKLEAAAGQLDVAYGHLT